jgi:GNAT superfamily N-acetyltransferase
MSGSTERWFSFERVEWGDPRAIALRSRMDREMSERYATPDSPEIDEAVRVALTIDPADILATVLVIDDDGTPIAHAALRTHDGDWEVKRVIVAGDHRGRGVGRALMNELERIARVAGVPRLILQTGSKQPDAVALYERIGYTPIPIYEPYIEAIPHSFCFEKFFV